MSDPNPERDRHLADADKTPEVNASEVNASEVNASEVNASEVNASEVNASEVNASEVNVPEVNVPEVPAPTPPSERPPDVPAILPAVNTDAASPPEIPPINQNVETGDVPQFGSNFQERIESQKEKEKQDQQVKNWIDILTWASCGICLLAIIGVVIARSDGCQGDRLVVNQKNRDPKETRPASNAKQINPGKSLSRTEVGALNTKPEFNGNSFDDTSRDSAKRSATTKPRVNEQKDGSADSGNGSAGEIRPPDETIGLFPFNQNVKANDLLPAIAPLRLDKVKWKKNGGNGFLTLDKSSRIFIERHDAFDTLRSLTFIARFRAENFEQRICLVSFKNRLSVLLDKQNLQIEIQDSDTINVADVISNDKRWHKLALTVGPDGLGLLLDDQPPQTFEWAEELVNPLPTLSESSFSTTVGSSSFQSSGLTSASNPELVLQGDLDDVGFFWKVLSPKEISNLLAQ